MKSIIKYVSIVLLSLFSFSACSDYLDTNPTDKVSGTVIFEDAKAAFTAINGCYSLLWQATYVSSNPHQAVGHQSTLLAQDIMCDDMVQMAFDFYGWDYNLEYFSKLSTGTGSRSYSLWNMYYTIISNCNYITAEEGKIGGDQDLATNIVAQAYALRAFCYFELIQAFQRTYIGHENDPGVPIYTEPTFAGTTGKPRGTVEDVYIQINNDITKALELFETIGNPAQTDAPFIDYYVTKGFEARIALVQNRWADAYAAAGIARGRTDVRLLRSGTNSESSSGSEIIGGLSSVTLPSTLWGFRVIPDQTLTFASVYCALDARASNAYGNRSRKCISSWLYDRVSSADWRKAWWLDGNQGTATSGLNVNYGQVKRQASDLSGWLGDLIFMRAEEMLLIQAEAAARETTLGSATALLTELAAVRMTAAGQASYATYLAGLPTTTTLSAAALANTNTAPQSVLEEVLLQRRIELWGEIGRIKDILRLKQGFNRNYSGSNHQEMLASVNTTGDSFAFILFIPQSEFDGNTSMNAGTDQNPEQ